VTDDDGALSLDALARLAHEFRSPLTAILGFAELLRHRLDGAIPPEAQSHLDDLTVAAARLRRLADEMVALGAPDPTPPDPMLADPTPPAAAAPLAPIVQVALRQAAPAAAARGARIAGSVAAGLAARADAARLAQALDALIDNAIRHGRAGGEVAVIARAGEAPGEVMIEVADDGPGLAVDAVAEALRPYGRPNGAAPGAPPGGLGLGIAREIVAEQGGRLDIVTAPGQGFCARMVLPEGAAP